MNARERLLAMAVVGAVLLAGGAFLFHRLFYLPLQERQAAILAARDEIDQKREQVRRALADRAQLRRFQQLSLPEDTYLARREYERYLSGLLRQSGFEAGSFTVTSKEPDTRTNARLAGKKPIYTALSFTVLAHGKLESLVQTLDGFYRTGLLHRINNLSIQRPLTLGPEQRPGQLDINFTVEALIVSGASTRPYLLPNIDPRLVAVEMVAGLRQGPAGLALAIWAAGPTGPLGPRELAQPPRRYAAIADKNIFLGQAKTEKSKKVEVSRFVYLTDITRKPSYYEAFLYDRYDNSYTRLRDSRGFDQFRIRDNNAELMLEGKVIRIDGRDVIFRVGDKYYKLHVGQNLKEALDKPLDQHQVEALPPLASKTP